MNTAVAGWILVFMFHGQPMTSGPHDLETCVYMASRNEVAYCWNPKQPWARIGADGKPWKMPKPGPEGIAR